MPAAAAVWCAPMPGEPLGHYEYVVRRQALLRTIRDTQKKLASINQHADSQMKRTGQDLLASIIDEASNQLVTLNKAWEEQLKRSQGVWQKQ